MNLPFLIQILQNKITMLTTARGQAVSTGDLTQVMSIDQELLDSQATFSQLALLSEVTQSAAAANVSVADLVSSGVGAIQQIPIQGPNAGAVINGYNISAYATDALYENKIRNILATMPYLTTIPAADTYIQDVAPGSPITGAMIRDAVIAYPVDTQLLVAIMQNDSSLGTLGVGARTNNPGNVGNTGSSEQSYATWAEGVTAVAEWLSRHESQVDTSTIMPLIDSDAEAALLSS